MSKKVIVVGGTSGMGRSIAEYYATQGCKVGVTGRRQHLLNEMKLQFQGLVETACFDITKTENVKQIESLADQLGGLDLLVISAGGGDVSKDLPWEMDKWIVETNVNGFVQISNWAFNYFMKQGYGQLVTISSVAAYRGNATAPAYSAAKAFQSNYFEGLSLKAEKMNRNVCITCVEPGFVATKIAKTNRVFWVVPVKKATRQIINAIEKRKRKAYISSRWQMVAWMLKWVPYTIYKRIF